MVDTNGRAVVTGGAPPDFGVLEKRTEREIDSLLLSAPNDNSVMYILISLVLFTLLTFEQEIQISSIATKSTYVC